MTDVKILEQREVLGKDFKIYGDFENPLFLAKDVAEWIEHSNSTEMLKTVDENEKITITTPTKDCLVGLQTNTQYTFLTEDGLYEVLMQSRKPKAKEFKKEVKKILKDIRKHGMYATPATIDDLLNDPDFAINLLMRYKEEKQKINELERNIELFILDELGRIYSQLDKLTAAQNKPTYEQLSLPIGTTATIDNLFVTPAVRYTSTAIAKSFNISARALNRFLHAKGIQSPADKGWVLNEPYSKYNYVFQKYGNFGDKKQLLTWWTTDGMEFVKSLLFAAGSKQYGEVEPYNNHGKNRGKRTKTA